MKHVLEPLPRGSMAALELAVQVAAEWRGYYTHDPELLEAYDADLRRMRAALAAVRAQNAAVKCAAKLAQGAAQADPTPYH